LWGVFCDISQDVIEIQAKRVVTTFLAAYGNDELSRAARQYTGA
jgi:hypothetical protein